MEGQSWIIFKMYIKEKFFAVEKVGTKFNFAKILISLNFMFFSKNWKTSPDFMKAHENKFCSFFYTKR
jgi:hypothetical protein